MKAIDFARKWSGALTMKVMQRAAFSFYFIKRGGALISNCAASFSGLAVTYILYLPITQDSLSKINGLDVVLLTIGGLIGTILALVISLSVIPIQSAAENFSSSIVHLYREDRVTRNIFALLAIFCLASFLMAIGEAFSYSKPKLLPVGVLLIAISLDLLRWHHRHIIGLLGSNESIGKLSEKVKLYLKSSQNRIAFLAKMQWWFLPKVERQKLTRENIEQILSQQLYSRGPLKVWLNEFAEVAHKAVGKQEFVRAQLAIFALADIACSFLEERKNNLRVYPETETLGLVSGSDVNDILTPIYEHYRNICNNAVENKAETTCIHIVQALGRIAIHTTNLQAKAFRKNTAPLTYLPIGYLNSCIEMAQRAGMDDVALQGSDTLLNIAKTVPDNLDIADVYLSILKELTKIAGVFLAKSNSALSNRCLTNIMTIGHIAVEGKHFRSDDIVREITDKLFLLLSVFVVQQRTVPVGFLDLPMTPAYDLTHCFSLGYFVARATKLIEKQKDKDWVNPYYDFIEFNKPISRHLYKLGEQIDFGANFILWHLVHTIKHISKIFLDLFTNPISDNPEHLKQLESCFHWYLSFFWLTFSKKKILMELQFAEEATDALAFIGLLFYNLDRKEVTRICIDNIGAVAEAYQDVGKSDHPPATHAYSVVDVIMPIWQMRILMEARKDKSFVKQIDDKIEVFLKGKVMVLVGQEPLDTRKRQLQQKLRGDLHFSQLDKAIGVLKELLVSTKQAPQGTSKK